MRQHSLRLPDSLMEAIDSYRGKVPRNTYIVDCLWAWIRAEEEAKLDVGAKMLNEVPPEALAPEPAAGRVKGYDSHEAHVEAYEEAQEALRKPPAPQPARSPKSPEKKEAAREAFDRAEAFRRATQP